MLSEQSEAFVNFPNWLKFMYSEKATKFCEISTVDLSYVVLVKSTVEIAQNFVASSEYMNFNDKTKRDIFFKTCSLLRISFQNVVKTH